MRIGTRLILLQMAILLVVMGIYALVTLAFTRERVTDELVRKSQDIALALAVGTIHHLHDGDAAGVRDVVERVSADADVLAAVVYDTTGALVAASSPDLEVSLSGTIQRYSGLHGRYVHAVQGGPSYTCAIRDGNGALFGSLRIDLLEAAVLPDVIAQRNRILLTIAVLTLALGAAAYWVTRRELTEPLAVLTEGVEAVGTGDLDRRVEGVGPGEIGELARAFNRMSERLDIARQALRDEREYIRSVMDSLPDGVVVVDRYDRIICWNQTMSRRFGLPAGHVEGLSYDVAIPCVGDAGVRDAVASLRDGSRSEFNLVGVRLRLAPDRFLEVGGALLTAGASHTGDIVLVFADTTERVSAEQAVGDSERRLRSVVDSVLEGIIIIDISGTIQSFNRAAERIFGYEERDVVGRNVRLLMPEPDAARHDDYIAAYLRTGVPRIIGIGRHLEGRRHDGSRFPMDLSVSEFTLDGARMFTGTVRDITARLHLERQVQLSQRLAAVGELAAGIAHEIGTPLNVISGTAEYILADGDVADPHRDDLKTIDTEVKRIADLVRRLMDFARQDERDAVPIDLVAIIESVLLLVERQIVKAGVTVDRHVTDGTPPVLGDRGQLQQVVLNVVVNAWQALPEGGLVSIEVGPADEPLPAGSRAVSLRVTDNGAGIADDEMDRIFDTFYTTKPAGEGTGLGLAIVHRIVEGHGGTIDVTSRAGEGTTFTVRLPVA